MRVQAPAFQWTQYAVEREEDAQQADNMSDLPIFQHQADQVNLRFGQADPYAYLSETPGLTEKEQAVAMRLKALLRKLAEIKANGAVEHDWRERNIRRFELDGQLYAARYAFNLLQIAPVDAWRPDYGPDRSERSGKLFGAVKDADVEDGFFLQVNHNAIRFADHRNSESYDYQMPPGGDKLNHLRILGHFQALLELR